MPIIKPASKPSIVADEPDAPPAPAEAVDNGISCRGCGCRHLPVYYTRQRGGEIIRVRRCRNCGRQRTTREQ